jgi:hypothetical protein
MAKIAYNRCFGGFGLSHVGIMRYAELKGIKVYPFVDRRLADKAPLDTEDKYRPASAKEAEKALSVHYCTTPEFSNDTYWSSYDVGNVRHDPVLIQVIEELGEKANGQCAQLEITELPSGTLYRIDEYDGRESVETNSSYEWTVAP